MPAVRPAPCEQLPLPALPIAPIELEIPAVSAVFHPCIVAQRMTADLVIYTRDLGRVITVAYPVGLLGVRIVPSGLFGWMERRGLVIECFCALVSSQPVPARFVDEFLSRHTVVRCHHVDNRCGFYLDLTKIHMMTIFDSHHRQIPTLLSGVPKIASILARWRNLANRDPTLLSHPAPFVKGYFSIHTSMYPGIHQLRSGLLQPLAMRSPLHRRAYHPYHRRSISLPSSNQSPRRRVSDRYTPPLTPVAGPSESALCIASKFSERETDALDALKIGLGISQADLDNLFEQCDHCSQSFMRSALRVHIKDVKTNCDIEGDRDDAEDDTEEETMTDSVVDGTEEDTDTSVEL